jgi:hypothetical protein
MPFNKTRAYEVTKRVVNLKGSEGRVFKLVLDNKQVKDLIIALNTEGQLMTEHVDALGNQLFNQYTQRTTYAQSDPLGRGGQPYEVFQTGDYYDTFRVQIGAGFIEITSNPEKPGGSLYEMYNENLEGLTESSIKILNEFVRGLYQRFIRQEIIS